MRHFPIFLDTRGRTIVVSGVGECAVAKLRLILKTEAKVVVFGTEPHPDVVAWAATGRVRHHARAVTGDDIRGAALVYAANDDAGPDSAAADLAREAGVPVLVVDNLDASDFITPAIVDRDPVTVAIGTEGTAPVLARKIKASVEEMLPPTLGLLARIADAFRPTAERLPTGRVRREFWSAFFFDRGPAALAEGEEFAARALDDLLTETLDTPASPGHVTFVGAGPGDPELLTLKARKALHEADVVIHDRLIAPGILELARREATLIDVGKTAFGPSWKQDDINALLIEHGAEARVVRLKSGDGGVFGRLDEETEALEAAGIAHSVIPGITSAAAAAAALKLSLTRRGRNTGLRILTGHQTDGYADHDWRALAAPGEVAAIYMGKAAANYLRGRLLMHGAAPDTPITVVENASRPEQRIVPATLLSLGDALADVDGPAVLMLGLAPRGAAAALQEAL